MLLAALSPHCLLLLKPTCPGTCVSPLGTVRALPGSVLRPPPSLPVLPPDMLFQALPTSHVLQPQFPEQGLPELPALTSTRLLSSRGTHESNTRRSISTPSSPPPPAFPSTSNRATLHLGAQAGHLGHSPSVHHPHPPLPTSHQDLSEYFPNSSTGNRCHPNGSPSILLQHCNGHLRSGPHNPFPTGSRGERLKHTPN